MPPYSMPLTTTPLEKTPPLFYNKKEQKKETATVNLAQLPQGRHHHPRLSWFSAWRFLSPSTGFSQGPESHGALNTSTCASHPVQSAAPEVKADGHGDGGRFGLWATVRSVSSERLTNRMRFPNRIMPCPPMGAPKHQLPFKQWQNVRALGWKWIPLVYVYIYI